MLGVFDDVHLSFRPVDWVHCVIEKAISGVALGRDLVFSQCSFLQNEHFLDCTVAPRSADCHYFVFVLCAAEFGVDAVVFGYLQTSFSLVQLLGSPVIGRLCDSYGPNVALQLSQLGSGLSYLLLGTATSVPLLFASRVPTLLMHTMHCCQAFIATLSPDETRSLSLGRLTISCACPLCPFDYR